MRNMSFMLTTEQIRNRTKTVTRRLGWYFLKAGDYVCACKKCQGLKKGEKIEKISTIKIISVRQERLDNITKQECIKEGFPDMSPSEFIGMFCKEMTCSTIQDVNRIEFEYTDNRRTK